ncbi:MAG: hypothetical protein ACXWC9_02240 [Pseudobdellovibrionaceae bacterium]
MKIMGSLLVLLLSVNVFAGPEEHKAAQSCYSLQAQPGVFVPAKVPYEVCLESLLINPRTEAVTIESYFQPELFKDLKVTSLTRTDADVYAFEASSILSEVWNSSCGDGELVRLKLKGQVDSLGNGSPSKLQVSVEVESTPDVCHSEPQLETFGYLFY